MYFFAHSSLGHFTHIQFLLSVFICFLLKLTCLVLQHAWVIPLIRLNIYLLCFLLSDNIAGYRMQADIPCPSETLKLLLHYTVAYIHAVDIKGLPACGLCVVFNVPVLPFLEPISPVALTNIAISKIFKNFID